MWYRFAQQVLAGVVGASLLVALPAVAATIVGTPGDDVLVGTNGADVIRAGAGDDRVDARAGRDRVSGGAGDDVLVLGPGADRATSAWAGRDEVFAGPGPDVIGPVASADLGRGKDTYVGWGARGFQRVLLGRGDDVVPNREGPGYDACEIRGGPGNDRISWWGNDHAAHTSVLRGGPGADRITGGYNADRIYGGGGPDIIREPHGWRAFRLFGGPGDDTVHITSGTGLVDCGRGRDIVRLAVDVLDSVTVRDNCEVVR